MSRTSHSFSADRPIARLGEDRLQRATFAESIAQAITTWHGDDSLVMALYGGWGDGKTSVKGMVVDAMKKDANTCPYIVHFNPWEWAGQNQLAQVFFDEIGKQIAHQGSEAKNQKAEECGLRLRKLGKYLNLTGSIVTPVMYAASLAFPITSIFAPVISKVFRKSGDLAEQAAEAVKEQIEREETSLAKLKLELKEVLKALNRNIVVLLDDIDRLAADEIKLLFQLVKANSDFPNLIFFLFFQRDIIERALGRTIRTGVGKEYLEKIVQVPLSLPHVQRPLLERFLESKLSDLLKRRGLEKRFDWPRFKELWRDGLSVYFQNLRDAARFFSTYEFHAASFPDPEEFDPVDLFALEVIRVFELGVYNTLATSHGLLRPDTYALFQHHLHEQDPHESWNNAIKQIVYAGKAARADAVTNVLRSLFPVETFTLEDGGTGKIARFQRESRVGHPGFFGRYFHFCIPQGDLPQTLLQRLLGAASDSAEFKKILAEVDQQHLALEALTRLCAHRQEFDAANAGPIAVALFDLGDHLVGRYSEDWEQGLAAISFYLIEAHLQRLSTRDERFATLKRSFLQTGGIYVPAWLLWRQISLAEDHIQNHEPRGITRDQRGILEKAQLDELVVLCVKTFEKAAASGNLKRHPKLREVLAWWLQWSRASSTPHAYFRELAGTDDGVTILLEQYLGERLSDDSRRQFLQSMYDRGLNGMDRFIPIEEVKGRVENLAKKPGSERVVQLCTAFLELFREHERNKGDFRERAPESDQQPPEDQEPTA